MEQPKLDPEDPQGGKAYGLLMEQRNKELDIINKEFLENVQYKDEPNLAKKLERYKRQFLEFDLDASGDITSVSMERMLENLGHPKNQLEIKEIIKEIDTTGTETVTYREFLWMMLGKESRILKVIILIQIEIHLHPGK